MKRALGAALGLIFVGQSHAELDAQAIALNCRNCHAASESAVPALEPFSAQQISQMLLDFKYDRKPATLMPRITKGYSDEELKAVADYLGRR